MSQLEFYCHRELQLQHDRSDSEESCSSASGKDNEGSLSDIVHLTRRLIRRMQEWLWRSQVRTAQMRCDDSERRYVRTGTVLGGALQWSPGLEVTAIKQT